MLAQSYPCQHLLSRNADPKENMWKRVAKGHLSQGRSLLVG